MHVYDTHDFVVRVLLRLLLLLLLYARSTNICQIKGKPERRKEGDKKEIGRRHRRHFRLQRTGEKIARNYLGEIV